MKDGYFDMAVGAEVDLIRAGKMDDNIAIITRIVVPKEARGHGFAADLMQKVLDDADDEGVMLILAVESYDNGLSNEQLVDWYTRMGFILMSHVKDLPASVIPMAELEPGSELIMMRKPGGNNAT